MPNIGTELMQAPRPLLDNMKRLLFDRFRPIADREPDVTKHIRAIIQDTLASRARAEDYTPDFWAEIKPGGFSPIVDEKSPSLQNTSLTLVERHKEGGKDSYRYRVGFSDAVLLLRFVIDKNKVSLIELDGMQLNYP
jgi:hypothetical protein